MDKQTIENHFQRNYMPFYFKYLPDIKNVGKNYMAVCPFHDDHNPSLSVNDQTGLFNCFGCDAKGNMFDFYARKHNLNTRSNFPQILNEIAETFGITNGNRPEKSIVTTCYNYRNESGHLLYQIERSEPKSFRIRRPDGNGGWIYNKKDTRIVPYHLPDIINTTEAIIVEGEKDADNLIALGFTATTNPFGAGKWPGDFGQYFKGKYVTLFPDNDQAGFEHMHMVAENLKDHAASIKWIDLPGLPPKGDVSDFVANFSSNEEAAERLAIMIEGAAFYEQPEGNIISDYGNSNRCSTNSDKSPVETTTRNIGASATIPLAWPAPLDKAAYYGVIGDWVKRVDPNTEADPAALLFQGLNIFGNMFGPNPYFMVEATEHRCNENLLLVGATSKGRKGTSMDHVRRIGKLVDTSWESECIKSGLTSGEGLIYHVRDPREKQGKIPADNGVVDKRLVAYESEFASILKIIERKDNTLSATIRDAWDHGHLRTLAKNSPVKATGAHISIVSHVTKAELMARLSNTESFNGFANRFLFVCVKRSKLLPEGGGTVDLSGILPRFHQAMEFVKNVKEMRRDEDARAVWREIYGELTREQPGILGSVLARDAAHVVRLSMIYALLDCSAMIRREHLLAALACWDYVEASAKYIFESMTGDPTADKIYEAALTAGGVGITRKFINDVLFQRNMNSDRIDHAIKSLSTMGKARIVSISTGGRPENRIYATQ